MRLRFSRSRMLLLLFAGAAAAGGAQEKPEAPQARVAAPAPAAVPAGQPQQLSLAQAIELARQNSAVYQAALSEAGVARESSSQARDALLPQVGYTNQVLYTQ